MIYEASYNVEFSIALMLLRVTAGILFFFQGYDKLFRLGTSRVLDTIADPIRKTLFAIPVLRPMVFISSWVELLGGLCLILGLFKSYALYALSADLAIVSVIFSLMKAMWDMQFYFPRFAMIVALLLLPTKADIFTLERFL
ncbi:MAG: DoxX family membrane protein [Bacteroidota bacterium]